MVPLNPATVILVHSRLVSRDLAREFALAGREVVEVQPAALSLDSIRALVARHRPGAVVGINHSPELAWVVSREGVPYVSWTVDPLSLDRLRVLEGTRTDLVVPFLHRSSQVPLFRAMGFERAVWLPLAAPRHRFEGLPGVPRGTRAASFVGSSLLDEAGLFEDALGRWAMAPHEAGILRGSLEPLVDLALERADFGGLPPGGQGLPESLLSVAGESAPLVAEAVNAWISARFRQRRVGDAAREHLLDVFGDGGWELLASGRWRGALPDGRELSEVYATSLANLDVPRLHQRDIATLRAFDVAACGGCLLAEPSADLCRVLEPGVEFLPYRDAADLRSSLERLAAEPERGRVVGEAARIRAAAEHRLEERAGRILSALGE